MLAAFWRDKTERYGAINTHDVAKFIALIIMTIDHIGAYCYPDELWWRAIGRITFPVWFFLVGYARSQSLPRQLLIVAALLVLVHPFVGQPVFTVNALVSIIICRLCVRWVEARGWLFTRPGEIGAVCAALWLPTIFFFEYGGLGVAFALWGAMARLEPASRVTRNFAIFCLIFFLVTQLLGEDYDRWQSLFIIVGTSLCCWQLTKFDIHPVATGHHGSWWAVGVRFISRESMWYYAIHRVFLQAFAAYWMLKPKVDHFTWISLH